MTENPTRLSKAAMAALALAFTVVAFLILARDLDFKEVREALTRLRPAPFVLSFGVLSLATLLRAWRFHLLTRQAKAPFLISLETILIGYFFLTTLPFRSGEILRVGYFSRRSGQPFLTTTAAAATERALDLIALAVIAAVFLSNLAGEQLAGAVLPPWLFGTSAVSSIAMALLLGYFLRKRLRRLNVSPKKAAGRLYQLLQGLAPLGSPREFLPSLGISLVLWFAVVLTYRFAFYSTDLNITFADAAVVMLGTSFAIALPSAPGFVGTYHLGFVAGAALVGIAKTDALPVAIILHLVIQAPFLPIGGLVLYFGGKRTLTS